MSDKTILESKAARQPKILPVKVVITHAPEKRDRDALTDIYWRILSEALNKTGNLDAGQ